MPVDGPITIPPRQRCMPSERRDPGQIWVPTGPTSFCFSPLQSWSVMPAHGQSSACACADMTVNSYLRSCEPDRCYQHKRTPVQTICTPVFFWDHRRAENTGVLGPKAVVYDLCRAAGYDASQLDAVRKRSEGGRPSHTRMHSFAHNPRRTQHGARTTQSPPRRAIQCTHDARTTARTPTRMLTTTGRIANSDTQRPGAVRKWSEGGIPSRTRAHSRTNHITQAQLIPHPPLPSSPRPQPHLHASTLARTHARFPHAGWCTLSSQSRP